MTGFKIPAENLAEMREWIAEQISCIPVRISDKTVSEYVESHRILPPGTPRPGPWSNAYTPYLVEIQDNMSAKSVISRTILAKAAQVGATAAAENCLAFWIDEVPAAILMMSATNLLLDKWSRKRLDPLIDSCGFRHKIGAQSGGSNSRRTGDTATSKEFPGGFLELSSAQSASSMRSDSIRVLIRDEVDGAKAVLDTGEGQWMKVSEARTSAFGDKAKILDFSTPTTSDESVIWPEYESGDQRRFFVPCPLCGEMQILEWEGQNGGGMRWSLDEHGELERVWYECEHCEQEIGEHHKSKMLAGGEWRPTSKSYDPTVRSYHISALYSPPGMKSWRRIVSEWLRAQDDPEAMRAFVNLNLGLPYIEDGERPSVENAIKNRGNYDSRTIPSEQILFLTLAIDVQLGSEKDKANPPRLELEVLGHGAGYRTWSVEYRRIEGDVTDSYEGAWANLNEMSESGKFVYQRKDGRKFAPAVTFIDSGEGKTANIVYEFCERWTNCYPIKGRQTIKQRLNDIPDQMGEHNFEKYRVKRIGAVDLVTISTNRYKHKVYNNLKIPRRVESEIQRPGFCDFPKDYGKRYFEMLTAEVLLRDGSFDSRGRRNEALDVRVYNLAAGDYLLDTIVRRMRENYVKRGATKLQAEMEINTVSALEYLAADVGGVLVGLKKNFCG